MKKVTLSLLLTVAIMPMTYGMNNNNSNQQNQPNRVQQAQPTPQQQPIAGNDIDGFSLDDEDISDAVVVGNFLVVPNGSQYRRSPSPNVENAADFSIRSTPSPTQQVDDLDDSSSPLTQTPSGESSPVPGLNNDQNQGISTANLLFLLEAINQGNNSQTPRETPSIRIQPYRSGRGPNRSHEGPAIP